MKIIDNFDTIESLLDWPNDDVFYFCQIIQRRKDQENKENFGPDNKVLKDIYIESLKKYLDKKQQIKDLCAFFKARAYIHLNKRSKKDVAFECLKIMADRMSKGEYQSLRSVYATACGQKMSDDKKKWIIDIDFNDEQLEKKIISEIELIEPEGNKIITVLPTVNGKHYISYPFNSAKAAHLFSYENPIQKNNPTILYASV